MLLTLCNGKREMVRGQRAAIELGCKREAAKHSRR